MTTYGTASYKKLSDKNMRPSPMCTTALHGADADWDHRWKSTHWTVMDRMIPMAVQSYITCTGYLRVRFLL